MDFDQFCELFQAKDSLNGEENPETSTRVRTDTMVSVKVNEEAFHEYLSTLNEHNDD